MSIFSDLTFARTQEIKARIIIGVVALIALLGFNLGSSLATTSPNVSPDEALKRLMEGNARFVSGHLTHVEVATSTLRHTLANKQKPFAVIVGCSDSRVGPEIVFDEGLGDIFVIRTAGEVVDAIALGSIEYAGTSVVVRSQRQWLAVKLPDTSRTYLKRLNLRLSRLKASRETRSIMPYAPRHSMLPRNYNRLSQSSLNSSIPVNLRLSLHAMIWIRAGSNCFLIES
jgi:hypothetical protein